MELDVSQPYSFDVVVAPPPVISVTASPAPTVIGLYAVPGTPGVDGQPGPTGPAGPAFDGTAWWYGQGPPPEAIIGSKPGDVYMDLYTGTIYELN